MDKAYIEAVRTSLAAPRPVPPPPPPKKTELELQRERVVKLVESLGPDYPLGHDARYYINLWFSWRNSYTSENTCNTYLTHTVTQDKARAERIKLEAKLTEEYKDYTPTNADILEALCLSGQVAKIPDLTSGLASCCGSIYIGDTYLARDILKPAQPMGNRIIWDKKPLPKEAEEYFPHSLEVEDKTCKLYIRWGIDSPDGYAPDDEDD